MNDIGRIVQQANSAQGPRKELAAKTRELVVLRYVDATKHLEAPLIERARQLEEGAAAQRQQVTQLEMIINSARTESLQASRLLVPAIELQSAAEKIDLRIRALERLSKVLE